MLNGREKAEKSTASGRKDGDHRHKRRRGTVLYVFDPTAVLAILLAIFYTLFGGFGQTEPEDSAAIVGDSVTEEELLEDEEASFDGWTLFDEIASIFDSWFGGNDADGETADGLLSFWNGYGGWSSNVYTGDYDGLAELDEEHLAVDEETGIEYVDNTILVLVEDGLTNAQKESIALSVDGVVIGEYEGMAGLLQIEVEVSSLAELEALAGELEENELVYYACYDYVAEYDWEEETESESGSDISDSTLSELLGRSSSIAGDWWRDAINIERTWEEFGDCFGEVLIGVVDSGINISQSDVSGKILFTTPLQKTRNESVVEADSSDANHGTAVTSIIIADQDNIGTDGIADQATLYFSAYSEATSIRSKHRVSLMMCQTLEEANAGCRVINHSTGYLNKGYSEKMIAYSAEIMGELTSLLVESGWDGLIVQSAGNDGDDASGNGFWATYKSGSSDLDDHILIVTGVEAVESGSNVNYQLYAGYAYGDVVDICAPAVDIEVPWSGSYDSRRGTSYAAPMVTAAAGLIWSADPDMTAAEVKDCLVNGYRFELTSSVSGDTYPMLDVYSAVERALCCVLEGMVVYEDDAPAEGITVQAVDADGNVLDEAITDADGLYVLRSNRLTTDHLRFQRNEEEVTVLDYPEEYRTYDADAARSDDEEDYDPHDMEDVILPLTGKMEQESVSATIDLTDYYDDLYTFIELAGLKEEDGDSWKYVSDSMQISIIDPNTMQGFIVANTDSAYSVYGVKIGDDRESALESISDDRLMIWTSRPSLNDCDLEIYVWDEAGVSDVVAVELYFDENGNVEEWSVTSWPEGEVASWYIPMLQTAHEYGLTGFEDWQAQYIRFIEEDYFYDDHYENMYACQLIYIDGDDIPELYIEYGSTAGGSKLVYYDADELVTLNLWTTGLLYYESENLLLGSGGHMDHYYDTVYTISDGEFSVVAYGTYGAEDDSNVQFDADGNAIYEYYWNGEEVSKAEYDRLLDEAFDTEYAVHPFGKYNTETGVYESYYNTETGMYDGFFGMWDIGEKIVRCG